MNPELTNLLPPERIRAFRREYVVRLATIGALLLAALLFVAALLLVPSYRYLDRAYAEKQSSLAALGEDDEAGNGAENAANNAAILAEAAQLASLGESGGASDAIRSVLAVPRPGIALSGITFAAFSEKKGVRTPATIKVSGIAATREALRSYDLALSEMPSVSSADLPISAYAKESNIAFAITLTERAQP